MSTAELASPTIAPEKAGLLPWHEQPWRKLRPALEGGRLPHAWLLSGRDGLGKTRFAHALAQALLCHQNIAADERDNAQACMQCPACHQFMAGTHPDFMSLAVPEDKTIIRVNEMREFIQRLQLSSGYAQGRVGIVMQAEAMNASAANALLKTLEEPPANTWLFLVSAHPSRLPATIRSRCQFLAFAHPQPMWPANGWNNNSPALHKNWFLPRAHRCWHSRDWPARPGHPGSAGTNSLMHWPEAEAIRFRLLMHGQVMMWRACWNGSICDCSMAFAAACRKARTHSDCVNWSARSQKAGACSKRKAMFK